MLYPPMGEWDILKAAISECGEKHQIIIAIEELSELIKELTKYLRNGDNEEHLTEEMADVYIMLEQLLIMFNNQEKVTEYEQLKLSRLWQRLHDGTDL